MEAWSGRMEGEIVREAGALSGRREERGLSIILLLIQFLCL